MDRNDSIKFKQQLITALKASPDNERVSMYEKGRAMDLSLKLKQLGTKNITIVVLESPK
jgi:hypothetical protein